VRALTRASEVKMNIYESIQKAIEQEIVSRKERAEESKRQLHSAHIARIKEQANL